MEQSRHFTRCMGRWLMSLLLVMLTSLAMRAASVEVWTSDVAGAPGSTVVIPVYVTCDVDITAFMINFSTDLGVTYSNVVFSDRINPSANPGFGATNGNLIVYNPSGIDVSSLDAGEGVVADIYVDIPADADPGVYMMTLGNMQFMAVGTSGSGSTIYVSDVHATLTVKSLEPEPYACYTPSNTTLTFYYDTQRSNRSGTTFDLNEGNHQPGWQDDDLSMGITRVVFNPAFANARPKSTYKWFAWMYELQSIVGLNYLNTAEVTTMAYMFCGCNYESLDLSHFNTSKVTDMSYMFSNCSVTSLDVSGFNTSKVADMTEMFYCCESLTSIDVSSFNTSNVTSMSKMFSGCSGLTSLDLSSFNTSKVSNMGYMFLICSDLVTIYVGSGWSTSSVTYSTNMFRGCTSLVGGKGTTYDANHVDKAYAHIDGGTSNPGYLTDVDACEAYACYTPVNSTLTFYYDNQRRYRQGKDYDLNTGESSPEWYNELFLPSSYNVPISKVVFDPSFADARPTSTYNWFREMRNLQSITGINYLNTSEVTNMAYMFEDCQKLSSLDLSNFITSKVTDMRYMFYGCSRLSSLQVSYFNTANVTKMNRMFMYCSGLETLDLSGFNTTEVTNMIEMFGACSSLTTIYVGGGWSTTSVTSSSNMFGGCTSLVGSRNTTYNSSHVDKAYAHVDGGVNNPGYLTAGQEAYACYTPSNTTLTFYFDSSRSSRSGTIYLLNYSEIESPGWQYDNVNESVTNVVFNSSFASARPTNMVGWFYYMTNLTNISGMQYLNTSLVTDMKFLFGHCTSMWYVDLSYFNTSNVTNMEYMFNCCEKMETLDLSSFNTSHVTNMQCMFEACGKLQYLDVSSFNTAKVTNMYRMFYACSALPSLDVTSFNTANVSTMNLMFYNCDQLTSLDLSSFNTANVTDMGHMFWSSNKLATIYVGNGWSTASVTSSVNMFLDCFKLVGGKGTTYSASHVGVAYAHIDGGTSNPGYFTEKPIEAYACYTPANTTLTFYYDNLRTTRPGRTYEVDVYEPGWYTDGTRFNVTKAVFDPSFAGARTTYTRVWFANMTGLESITGLNYLNTSEVRNMRYMFYYCSSLTELDLSSFNTAKVTGMDDMFSYSSNLTTIYVGGGWDASAATGTSMFNNCYKLVGGQGTTYSGQHVNKDYARIDGGPDYPGYFTAKYLRGDVSGDGEVDVADVALLIKVVLGQQLRGFIAEAANLDGDPSTIDVGDVSVLINIVLGRAN